MRRGSWLLVASAALLAISPADAALKKFNLINTSLQESTSTGPGGDFVHFFNANPPPGSVVVIDDATPGSPLLRKWLDTGNVTVTVPVPSLVTSIFLSNNDRSGPGVTQFLHGQPTPLFTGTGGTGNGSQIRWGTVTGWSVTGQVWCHSLPAVICTLADRMDQTTTDAPLESEFYDLGTWSFHGTGFTAIPFILQYFTSSPGNNQAVLRGPVVLDGTVPALQLITLALVGVSMASGGALWVRRRGKR